MMFFTPIAYALVLVVLWLASRRIEPARIQPPSLPLTRHAQLREELRAALRKDIDSGKMGGGISRQQQEDDNFIMNLITWL